MKTKREIELEKIVSELTRKLAEQQALLRKLSDWYGKGSIYGQSFDDATGGCEELTKLLTEAREEGRKEAVPDGLLDRLTRHVVVGEDGRKWVELCDIEAALALGYWTVLQALGRSIRLR